MGRIVQPGPSRYDGDSGRSRGTLKTFFASFTRLIHEYGLRGVVALAVAAVLAFTPTALLIWFNVARYSSVIQLQPNQTVVVRPARHERDQEKDEPGETALLTVTCEVRWVDIWQPLLIDDDPARADRKITASHYVRRELVYLRPVADVELPFGLLGRPPVSVWLPPGDYDVLVVHEAPSSDSRIDAPTLGFPLISAKVGCSLENCRKTECRIPLPHYDRSNVDPLQLASTDGTTSERRPTADELRPIVGACEGSTALPSFGGYVLSLPEPIIRHTDDHRGCAQDFAQLRPVAREWTREQLAAIRNWLPGDATTARKRLTTLIDALQWREFLQGWYCYAAAGIAGLVFTRWGATAMLEPGHRRESIADSLKLIASIFLFSALGWLVFQVLTKS